jgi:hypothetical protein
VFTPANPYGVHKLGLERLVRGSSSCASRTWSGQGNPTTS